MKLVFTARFGKDLRSIEDKSLKADVQLALDRMQAAHSVEEVGDVIKMKAPRTLSEPVSETIVSVSISMATQLRSVASQIAKTFIDSFRKGPSVPVFPFRIRRGEGK